MYWHPHILCLHQFTAKLTKMNIIKPSVKLEAMTFPVDNDGNVIGNQSALHVIEKAGRTCYKSEDKITDKSAEKFCKMIQTRKHDSVMEHASVTFRIITSRDVLQELVRHRIASYSVESSRYCCYSPDKKGMQFIQPAWISDEALEKELNLKSGDPISHEQMPIHIWYIQCEDTEGRYNTLISECGWQPQQARVILPGCLKTEIVMTANFREWLHFLELRTSTAAHPDMRIIANMIQDKLSSLYPTIFTKEERK
jgi:thymidylate synthase (FAD)